MTILLSDAKARNLNAGDKSVSAGGVPGLLLQPTKTKGRGKWILRFTSPTRHKRRDMGLGTYPEISIANARRAAFEAHDLMASGVDPIEHRDDQKRHSQILSTMPTFADAARQVHAMLRPGFRNSKHAAQWITTLETYIFPVVGTRSVDGLRASDFAEALQPIWLTKSETASRVRQRCDKVMNWCAAQGFIVASPLGAIDMLLPSQASKRERIQHHPALPWRSVPDFVYEVFRNTLPTNGKRALEFCILTAARSGEVRGMQWDELDLKNSIWSIPPERMKANALHRVPLSSSAMSLLECQRDETGNSALVFPSLKGTPISDMTLTKIMRDVKVESDTPGRVATVHGFRSAFRDWASENGCRKELAERALAHTIRNTTEAAYHRTDLLDQRRPIMESWGEFVSGREK